MKKAWVAIALLAIAALGWLFLSQYKSEAPAPMATPPPGETINLQITPTPDPDIVEVPPEDEEDESPDPARVSEVEKLEFALMELLKQRPTKDQDIIANIRKSIALIDLLLRMHPTTSIRYAELIEARASLTRTLLTFENPNDEKREAAERESVGLARDFARQQPKSALAHEVLGNVLLGIDSDEAKRAYEECLQLEPSNESCRRKLEGFKMPPGTLSCTSVKSGIGFYLGSRTPARDFPIRVAMGKETIYLATAPMLDARHIKSARSAKSEFGQDGLSFTFTREGSAILAETTGKNVGKLLAFGDTRYLFSAPEIRESITTGSASVTLAAAGAPTVKTVLERMCLRLETAQ